MQDTAFRLSNEYRAFEGNSRDIEMFNVKSEFTSIREGSRQFLSNFESNKLKS